VWFSHPSLKQRERGLFAIFLLRPSILRQRASVICAHRYALCIFAVLFYSLCSFYVCLPRLSPLARSRRQEVVELELRRGASIQTHATHPSHTFIANHPPPTKPAKHQGRTRAAGPVRWSTKEEPSYLQCLFDLEGLQAAAAHQQDCFWAGATERGRAYKRNPAIFPVRPLCGITRLHLHLHHAILTT